MFVKTLTTDTQWHNYRTQGPLDKISRRALLLSFPYPSPPIHFKGLAPEIFMLAYSIFLS